MARRSPCWNRPGWGAGRSPRGHRPPVARAPPGGRTARIGLPAGKALARERVRRRPGRGSRRGRGRFPAQTTAATVDVEPGGERERVVRLDRRAGHSVRARVVVAAAGLAGSCLGREPGMRTRVAARVAAGGRLHGGVIPTPTGRGRSTWRSAAGLRRARADAGRLLERRRGVRPGLRPRPGRAGGGRRRRARRGRPPARAGPGRRGLAGDRRPDPSHPARGRAPAVPHRRRGRLRRAVHRRGHGLGADLGLGGGPADLRGGFGAGPFAGRGLGPAAPPAGRPS